MSGWIELIVFASAELPPPLPDDEGVRVTRLSELPRAEDGTNFHGPLGERAKLRLSQAEHAQRISISAADGRSVHARAADYLDGLAVRLVAASLDPHRSGVASLESCVVLDVLSLDARGVQQAAQRFRHGPPTAWMWIGIRPRADGLFDVETFGLRKLSLREVHVPAVPERNIEEVSRFLNLLMSYAVQSGRRLKPGDATSFGWVDVRLVPAERLSGYPDAPWLCAPLFVRAVCADRGKQLPGVAVIYEPENDAPDAELVPGAQRAARIVEQLTGAARQCGLSLGIQVPRAASTAVVCRAALQGPPLEARRVEPDEPNSSGWVAVCTNPEHDHAEPDQFEVVALQQLAAAAPRLFSMLAAPPGTGLVVHDSDELTVLLPDNAPEP